MRRPSPLFMPNSNFPGPVDLLGLAQIFHKIDQNTISALQTENARLYADKSNLLQSINFGERFCGLEKQLAACCCSTQNDLNLILSKLPTSGTAAA